MKWYKHDPSAALAGMIGLTVEERGAYYTLIDLQYARAPHNDVTDYLVIKALGCRPQVWRRLKAALIAKGKVHETGGKLTANRVETEVISAGKLMSQRAVWRSRREEKQALKPTGCVHTTTTTSTTRKKDKEAEASLSRSNGKRRFQYPPEFEAFWQQYPLNVGKDGAHKAWVRVLKSGKATNEELIAGAMRYAADPNRDPSFTKHAATWLNAGCHTDGPLPARGGQGNGQHGRRHGSVLDALDRIGERLKEAGATDDYIPGTSGPRPLHEIEPSLGRPKPRELDQEVRQPNLKLVPPR